MGTPSINGAFSSAMFVWSARFQDQVRSTRMAIVFIPCAAGGSRGHGGLVGLRVEWLRSSDFT